MLVIDCVTDNSQDDYTIWSLFLVYISAALPDFAYRDTNFLPSLEGIVELCTSCVVLLYKAVVEQQELLSLSHQKTFVAVNQLTPERCSIYSYVCATDTILS